MNRPINILLIDDNPDDSFLFCEMLREKLGQQTKVDSHARLSQALESLQKNKYDVALIDIGLPDSQGKETIDRILKAAGSVPVLFLTGNENEVLAMEAVRQGAQDYLLKGEMTAALLARAIRYAIEREQLEQKFRHMEKMDAIGKLAGGIAHDFNNQLTGILGFSELLKLKVSDPKVQKYIDGIVTAAQRSSDLTRQLLAFSRNNEQHSQPTNTHTILHEVISMLKHSLNKRITIHQELKAEQTTVIADPSQLQNALLNLGINSGDAMPKGGEIHIATRDLVFSEKDCSFFPYQISPGTYIEIRLADTGQGIKKELQDKIFEPFFTTKEPGKGTGMGLAAVYGTVRQLQGAINLYSEEEKGTTFVICLPSVKRKASEASKDQIDITNLKGLHLLLIDDEPIVRELTCEMLKAMGVSTHVEGDPESGLAYYTAHAEDIDLVILDMVMPKMSGAEVFRKMQRSNPNVKVLIASGFTAQEETISLIIDGAVGFLQKPFRYDALASRIIEGVFQHPENLD